METSTRAEAHVNPPWPDDTEFRQLVECAAAGIAVAQTQLDGMLRPRVTAFLRAHFAARVLRRAGEIDDLAQMTMIRLFRVLAGALRGWNWDALAAYSHNVARNCVREGLRHNVAAQKRSLDRAESFDLCRHDRACSPSSPAQAVAFVEQRENIALGLSEVHANLFVALLWGDSLADVAAGSGVSVRTVQRWVSTLSDFAAGRSASVNEPVRSFAAPNPAIHQHPGGRL
jgi:DNA-directed RNA polymerase specialized sigma24 family protein